MQEEHGQLEYSSIFNQSSPFAPFYIQRNACRYYSMVGKQNVSNNGKSWWLMFEMAA
jgi:hypothetical protein